jgi:cyclase
MVKHLDQVSKHFTLEQLSDGVYAAIHTDGGAAICNAGLIDLGELLVVFDTFLTPQAAEDMRNFCISTFCKAPQIIINSHYHNDHTWGNQAFACDAQIISSTRTRQLFETEGKAELDWYKTNSYPQLKDMLERFRNSKDEQERKDLHGMIGYYEGLVEAMPNLAPCKADITFDDNLRLYGNKNAAELITFQGAHTASDTILVLPADGILFAGDLLFVQAHPYLSEGDPQKLLGVLQELACLDAACYVPGHGGIGTREDITRLMEYVEYCLESVSKLIETDPRMEDLTGIRIPDKFKFWNMPHMFRVNLQTIYERIRGS